jgi:mannose-6-phosphate isomerase-like protein (cupin superfamily)
MDKQAMVRYTDETEVLACSFGSTTRVVTGGEGGVANVHVVEATGGGAHVHSGYDEVYYVLEGRGTLEMDGVVHELRPGAVAVIPAGVCHAVTAEAGSSLRFIIFGSPAMTVDDERYRPVRCVMAGRNRGKGCDE